MAALSLQARWAFFEELATLMDVGASLEKVLKGRGFPADALLDRIRSGDRLAEAFAAVPGLVEPHEARCLEAAELAGEFPKVLRALAKSLMDRIRIRRELFSASGYPVLLAHAAVLILPLPMLFQSQGGFSNYLGVVGAGLLRLYALALLLGLAWIRIRCSDWKVRIPWLGAILRDLAEVRLFQALAVQQEAAIPVGRALVLAAAASGYPAWERAAAGASRLLEEGAGMQEILAGFPGLSPEVLPLVQVAEETGRPDTAFVRLAGQAAIRASESIRAMQKAFQILGSGIGLAAGLGAL